MKLSKKQVRHLLKLSAKNKRLRKYWVERLDNTNYLVATDAFMAVFIPTNLKENVCVSYDLVNEWYKKAKARELLTDDLLNEMLSTEYKHPIESITEFYKEDSNTVDEIMLNSKLLLTIQEIMTDPYARSTGIILNFESKLEVVSVRNNANGIKGIVLPMRYYY